MDYVAELASLVRLDDPKSGHGFRMTVLIFALAILASNRKEIETSELASRKQIWKPTNSEPMPLGQIRSARRA